MNTIHNVKELIDKVDEQKQINLDSGERSDLIFRGQNHGYKLEPKLMRYRDRDIANLEKLVITEFKRLSPPFVSVEPYSEFDWLVLAQHHGLPTRLLDWTYNPLSALWFSVNMVRHKGRGGKDEASIWVLRPSLQDYRKQQNLNGSNFDLSENIIYRPRNLTSRIINQSSIFTMHSMNDRSPLEKDDNFKGKLIQYKIDRTNEDKILDDLHVLNVNESTIYPDLEGLCGHLKWRYFERPRLEI